MNESPCCFTSSPVISIVSLLNFGHSMKDDTGAKANIEKDGKSCTEFPYTAQSHYFSTFRPCIFGTWFGKKACVFVL